MDAIGVNSELDTTIQLSADPLPFARSYQVEALEKAIKQNTIVFLETGSGKTLIAIMLLRSYAYLLRKPSPYFAVFLVPQVVLVAQQTEALKVHTDLKVGMYWGEMGVDYWDASVWKEQVDNHEVLVMTPAILLVALRHSFLNFNMIKVLVFDECHHARGKHPYACIMKEFYHALLGSGDLDLPRIFGMTASPVKTKGSNSSSNYWLKIHELETLMNSKVYTCESESVLAGFIPFSTPKFKFYQHKDIPHFLSQGLQEKLQTLKEKHLHSLDARDLSPSTARSIEKRLSKMIYTLVYCLHALGIWLASKAAHFLSADQSDFISWGHSDVFGEKICKSFCHDAFLAFSAYLPLEPEWTIAGSSKANLEAGLLTTKVVCLIESLLEYSSLTDIRCIVFVERVITSIVLQTLLAELLPKYNNWKSKYIAGSNTRLQHQSRKKQNEIVQEFREGMVNIIVATSILEEGLDVQSCNLVIRFDPTTTVISFIQSRGRARMQNSDYVLMVESGDFSTQSRLKNYLSSGQIMREESLSHASVPCPPIQYDPDVEEFYRVESTGATVTLGSSVSLIHFYCSRLPSDGYFKPAPRFEIDEATSSCTLYLPMSCPVKVVRVHGTVNTLKQAACLDACKQLHIVGALTDYLVPNILVEEAAMHELENIQHNEEQPIYFPPELVSHCTTKLEKLYHFYLVKLEQNYHSDISVDDILIGTRTKLEDDTGSMCFELEVDHGTLSVGLQYVGMVPLSQDHVFLCRKFQLTLLRILLDHNLDSLEEIFHGLRSTNGPQVDYLLLPSSCSYEKLLFNSEVIESVNFASKIVEHIVKCSENCTTIVHTKDGLLCHHVSQNALVSTPHNGRLYCVNGIIDGMNANSLLRLGDGSLKTYKEYYETRHGIKLKHTQDPLLKGRRIFKVHNFLRVGRTQKEKVPTSVPEHEGGFIELPPELCHIILSPIPISTVYSYSFIPSIMHRLESLLLALNLKKTHLNHSVLNVNIPTVKVLEAITTKKCQEEFHLESLETLGDSFLKYAVSQHLFKTCQNHHEGLLSMKRQRLVSNVMLCKLGCDHKLSGFIRNDPFDPKKWLVSGHKSGTDHLTVEPFSGTTEVYVTGRRNLKLKRVADVVEALIGAYLSEGGEMAAIMFMNWIGLEVDLLNVPYQREFMPSAQKLVNICYMESLLNYSFQDKSLLVEALTHGSYMRPEVSRCYQRLEYLGDSVLDHALTRHLYDKYPGVTPGLLTEMRSASVNNDCYAVAAIKAELHKHILHTSHDLHKHINRTLGEFKNLSLDSTFNSASNASLPKVLGDVIESLAGAIYIDSGYSKDAVFASIRRLFEGHKYWS